MRHRGRCAPARRRGQILGYNNTTFGARIQNLRATNFSKIRSQKTVTLHSPRMKGLQLIRRLLSEQPRQPAGRNGVPPKVCRNAAHKQKSPSRKTDFFAHEAGYRLCGAGLTAEKENSRRRGRRRPISQKQEEKDFTVAGLVPCCNHIVTLLSPNCNTFLSLFCNFFCEIFSHIFLPPPAPAQKRQNSSNAALSSRRPVTYQPGPASLSAGP